MKRRVITTNDGSKTLYIPEWNEQYHSTHGALQEALYVYIKQGLQYVLDNNLSKSISILEMGFGTGLNAYLSLHEAETKNLIINYTTVEAYPLNLLDVEPLHYPQLVINTEADSRFNKLHTCPWESEVEITNYFKLHKRQQRFKAVNDIEGFNLIYYDAFGKRVQPELWTEAIFTNMYKALKPNGVLVTYASVGEVKRVFKRLGATVQRIEGPPGKRHMLRVIKSV